MANPDLQLLLGQMLFKGMHAPESLWLGLTTSATFGEMTLANISERELKAEGYKRVEMLPRDWSVVKERRGEVQEVRITTLARIHNPTKEVTWPMVRGAFIATTPDNAGLLVAFTAFGESRIALPDDTMQFPIQIEI